MISTSFPVTGKEFINRREILERLFYAYRRRQNVALVGHRRIGKTSIIREFTRQLKETSQDKRLVTVEFNVQEEIGTPGRFALRLLRALLSSYLKLFRRDLLQLLEAPEILPANLIEIADILKSQVIMDVGKFLVSYFPPSPSNERTVMVRILESIDIFAKEQKIEIALILDEFQEIKRLDNSSSIGKNRTLPLLEGIISSQEKTWYLFTGSMIRLMNHILEDGHSPFYGRVEKIDVGGFIKEDLLALANNVSEKPITGEGLTLLWNISRGNPYYGVVICSKANFLTKRVEFIEKQHIKEAFVESLTKGELNLHCRYIFDTSLGRVSKSTLLKEITRCLSSTGMTPAELGKKLGRDRGVISSQLRILEDFDLIKKVEFQYHIQDDVLKLWLQNVYSSTEIEIEKIKKGIEQNYQEMISRLKTERGYLFESHIRELLRKFNGSEFQNRTLPEFESVDSLNIYDSKGKVFGRPSNIEVDALCLGNENWLCEFKYRNELADRKDLSLLIKKQSLIESKLSIKVDLLLFISTSGFTEDALTEKKVWCLGPQLLNAMLVNFGMRRIDELKEMGR